MNFYKTKYFANLISKNYLEFWLSILILINFILFLKNDIFSNIEPNKTDFYSKLYENINDYKNY